MLYHGIHFPHHVCYLLYEIQESFDNGVIIFPFTRAASEKLLNKTVSINYRVCSQFVSRETPSIEGLFFSHICWCDEPPGVKQNETPHKQVLSGVVNCAEHNYKTKPNIL